MRRFCSLGILLLGGFSCLLFAACSTTTPVKLVGLVQSSKTDENDNPTEIFLWDGKEAIPIEKNDSQNQLLEKVDSKIEAHGTLTEGSSGKKSLEIESFKVLRDAAE